MTKTRVRLAFILVSVIVFGALWFLAPLEFETGLWLGRSPWTAWTITVIVEGFLLLSLVSERRVAYALSVTWLSAALGQVRSAGLLSGDLGRDHAAMALAAGAVLSTTIVVGSLGGTHRMLLHVLAAHRALAERETAELAEAEVRDASARRAAALALAERAERERAERERAEAESLRAKAEVERTRAFTASEAERRAADERAAERAHALALAELSARRAPSAPESAGTARSARSARSAEERERAYLAWSEREMSGTPMDTAEIAVLLGTSDGGARGAKSRWSKRLATESQAELT
jgi:hypothetical protein